MNCAKATTIKYLKIDICDFLINGLWKLILTVKVIDVVIFPVVSFNSLVGNGEFYMLIDEGKVVCHNLPSTLEEESYRAIVFP